MSDRAVVITVVTAFLLFSGFLFTHNLPRWCATPHIGYNAVVQPLCR